MTKPLSKKQRIAILDRDNHQGQMRTYSEAKGWTNWVYHCPFGGKGCNFIQVHHIRSRRNNGGNNPQNLLSLYECQHTGRCQRNLINGYRRFVDPAKHFVVHPDMLEAFTGYDGSKNSFEAVFARRDEVLKLGGIFHNPLHDVEMLETANELTLCAYTRGWKMPK